MTLPLRYLGTSDPYSWRAGEADPFEKRRPSPVRHRTVGKELADPHSCRGVWAERQTVAITVEHIMGKIFMAIPEQGK